MKSACGSTINQNCSYIKNPGFSAAYTSTSNCQFTINKCDNCEFLILINFRNFKKLYKCKLIYNY